MPPIAPAWLKGPKSKSSDHRDLRGASKRIRKEGKETKEGEGRAGGGQGEGRGEGRGGEGRGGKGRGRAGGGQGEGRGREEKRKEASSLTSPATKGSG